MSARALELVIPGAARSGEVRGARWAAINLSAMAWTVPEDRNALVFASPRGGMLSNMSTPCCAG